VALAAKFIQEIKQENFSTTSAGQVQQVRDDWAAAQELHEREEREREDAEAHAYVGVAGDGSGEDDLADLG